ncbi:MAG: hypothetical protein PWQ91_147 [Eubacteriales bacterium]|nr:hypothetical protein [Eubacteriales bacterium]MDN5363086.1 hypothetical protein [Eubacteriales bacterium]
MFVKARVFRVFVQPRQVFRELLDQPDVLTPFLLFLGSQLLWLLTGSSEITGLLKEQLAAAGVGVKDLPLALWGIVAIILLTGTGLISILSLFINTLFLIGFSRIVGMEISFPFSASLIAYSQMPLVLRNVINAGYTLITRSLFPPLPLPFGILIPEVSGILRSALEHFDIFLFWDYIILGLGLRVASPHKAGKVWAVFLLFVLTNVFLSFLFPSPLKSSSLFIH